MTGLALGAHLKARRRELGFTLRDVEEITEGRISNAYLSLLETGKTKNPSLSMTVILAAAYCIPLDTIAEWAAIEVAPAPVVCPTCGHAMLSERTKP